MWVSDASGDPVRVIMAAPGASLAGELRARSPVPGETVLIPNRARDSLTADLGQAQTEDAIAAAHGAVHTRLGLALITHAMRIVTFNTSTAPVRAIRVHTGVRPREHEVHTLVRQAPTGSGHINPGIGVLRVRLDLRPKRVATAPRSPSCDGP